MGDPEFPDWFPEQVSQCVSRLEPGRIERGEDLSPEDDEAGEKEALQFIESLEIPECPRRCAQLFPRLWDAKRTVDRSLLRPRLRIWEDLDREEVLRVLLLATWPTSGRSRWEAKERDEFKFG